MIDCEKTAEELVHEISELLIRCEILEKEASEYTPVVSVAPSPAQVPPMTASIHQIATAAEEQTATTSEISSNMLQITQVVHDTAGGAHQSATAAAQLSGNAEELQRLVRQFKL